jgi:transcriptional repressor NrdR
MRCPYCQNEDTQVKDSRPTEEGAVIRRRRECPSCNSRFTTEERVRLRDLVVVKRTGRRAPFDREKLQRSVMIALRKRPISEDRVDQMISGIVRQLESLGDADIPSSVIGQKVMEALQGVDPVAYVRYASVYQDFREPKDFARFLDRIDEPEAGASGPKKK